jgi:hypothetical protein
MAELREINDERWTDQPEEGISYRCSSGGGTVINYQPPSTNEGFYLLRCQAEGEAAKIRLATCKTPVPNPNYAWSKG